MAKINKYKKGTLEKYLKTLIELKFQIQNRYGCVSIMNFCKDKKVSKNLSKALVDLGVLSYKNKKWTWLSGEPNIEMCKEVLRKLTSLNPDRLKDEIKIYFLNHKSFTSKKCYEHFNGKFSIMQIAGVRASLTRRGLIKPISKNNKFGYKKEKHSLNKNKLRQRKIWYNLIQESGEYGKVLSLPSTKPDFEESLLNISNNFEFDLYEYDKFNFIHLSKNIINSPIKASINLGPILNGIEGANENEYSHAILDYCGSFRSFSKDIETTICKNIVKPNGLVIMTFSKRSKKELDPFLMQFKQNISVLSQFAGFLKECIEKSTGEYILAQKPQEYRNNNHNMFSIFLKRIK